MERVNTKIIVSVLILMVAGVYRLTVMKQQSGGNLTRIIVGGYSLALVASVIDLVGGPIPVLTSGLLVLAVGTVLYTVLPDLFARLGHRPAATGTTKL